MQHRQNKNILMNAIVLAIVGIFSVFCTDTFAKEKLTFYDSLRKATHLDTLVQYSHVYEIGFVDGTFSSVALVDALSGTLLLTSKIVKRLNKNVDSAASIYYSLDTAIRDIKNKQLDIFIVFPEMFIKINKQVKLDGFLVAAKQNNPFDEYLLIVRKDRNIQSMNDLKDKKIFIYDCLEGELPAKWIDVYLAENKLPASKIFFNKVTTTQKASSAVLPVFFDQIDACIVPKIGYDTIVELNPQIGQFCKIIAKSPKFPNGLLCIRGSLGEDELRSTLEDAVLALNYEPEGKQLLKYFKHDSFMPYKPEYLYPVITLLNDYEKYYPGEE